MTLDLSDTHSRLTKRCQKIASFAEDNPGRRWILGAGWNQEKWGLGRFPTAAELDAVVSDRPVWLRRADGHAAWANSAAIEQAGVTAAARTRPGGRIEPLSGRGHPDGIFVDSAMGIGRRESAATRAQRTATWRCRKRRTDLLANGITAVARHGHEHRRIGRPFAAPAIKAQLQAFGSCPMPGSRIRWN